MNNNKHVLRKRAIYSLLNTCKCTRGGQGGGGEEEDESSAQRSQGDESSPLDHVNVM